MKTAGRVLLICLLVALCFCSWNYQGYCKEKTRKEYYKGGKLKAIYPYNDAGVLDGIVKQYYPSGQLEREDGYRKNVREGISKVYYTNGKLLGEGNKKNGKLEGITKLYYENGKLQGGFNYKNGKLEGIYKEYYETGTLKSEGRYNADKMLSAACYDEQGNPEHK